MSGELNDYQMRRAHYSPATPLFSDTFDPPSGSDAPLYSFDILLFRSPPPGSAGECTFVSLFYVGTGVRHGVLFYMGMDFEFNALTGLSFICPTSTKYV